MSIDKGPTSIAENKQQLRDKIAKDTALFLEKGNKVDILPTQTYAQQERYTVEKGDATRHHKIKETTE